mgnify:CR=1 FL=1
MNEIGKAILEKYQVRKTYAQKTAFIAYVSPLEADTMTGKGSKFEFVFTCVSVIAFFLQNLFELFKYA